MSSIKGSKTESNLLKSFAGESQARSRYKFFASVAKREGYEQISGVFLETAEQEKEHAEVFFKHMSGGALEITAAYPAGGLGTTVENLRAAAGGEHEEWTEAYPAFADIADAEGFTEIASTWRAIASIEREHESRYRQLLSNIESGTVFHKPKPILWQCRNCGYVHEGTDAPDRCPACAHAQSYFEPKRTNYA
jgi:rubrerythrin